MKCFVFKVHAFLPSIYKSCAILLVTPRKRNHFLYQHRPMLMIDNLRPKNTSSGWAIKLDHECVEATKEDKYG